MAAPGPGSDIDGPEVAQLSALAKKHSMWIVFGMRAAAPEGDPYPADPARGTKKLGYNTDVILDRQGATVRGRPSHSAAEASREPAGVLRMRADGVRPYDSAAPAQARWSATTARRGPAARGQRAARWTTATRAASSSRRPAPGLGIGLAPQLYGAGQLRARDRYFRWFPI
jgi:hypothetical protein